MRAKTACVFALAIAPLVGWLRSAHAAPTVILGGVAQTAVPQGAWSDGVVVIAPGVGMELAVLARPLPLVFGGEAGFAMYEWSRQPQRLALSTGGTQVGTIETTIERRSAMLFGHLFARLQTTSPTARWRPFVEGLFGFKHMRTEVELFGSDQEEPLARAVPVSSTGWSRGLGLGLDGCALRSRQGGQACWTMGGRYLQGGPMSFPGRGPWPVSSRGPRFDTSRTDTVIVYFGVRGEARRR